MRHYAYYAARSVRTLETVCAILVHELGLPPFAYEDYYTWKDRLQPYQGAWSEGETLQIRVLRADYDPVLRDHHASCPLDANTLIVVTGTRLPPKVRLALREALGIEPEVCEMWYDQAA